MGGQDSIKLFFCHTAIPTMDRKARLAALAARAGRTRHIVKNGGGDDGDDDDDEQQTGSFLAATNGLSVPPTTRTTTATTTTTTDRQPQTQDLHGGSIANNNDNDVIRTKKARTQKSLLELALQRMQVELDIGQDTTTSSSLSSPHTTTTTTNTSVMKKTKQKQQNSNNLIMTHKLNWDLKRDIQPNLMVLEKRTQKALVQLLKDRLENGIRLETAAAAVATEDEEEEQQQQGKLL